MGHHVSAVADTRPVLLALPNRRYLQTQGCGLGGLRREKRRESRRVAATQRDRRVAFKRTTGAALGQWSDDEIGDAVEQDVRTGHYALARLTAGEQRQSVLEVAV